MPADLALYQSCHWPHVKKPCPLPAAEEHPRQGEDLSHAEAKYPRELQLAPQIYQPLQSEHWIAQMGGDVARVDRTDTRTAENVYTRGRPEEARQFVEDVPEYAHFVRAPSAPARKDHRHTSLTHVGQEAAHSGADSLGTTGLVVPEARAASKSGLLMDRSAKSLRKRGSRTKLASATA